MTLTLLFKELQALNIELTLEGENLRISAPPDTLTERLRKQLKIHKSQIIELLKSTKNESIKTYQRPKNIPLSFAQQRLWFLDQFGSGAVYNMVRTFRIQGNLNIKALQAALNQLQYRHESLRTCFRLKDTIPYQIVNPAEEVNLPIVPTEDLSFDSESLSNLLQEEIKTPFDLSKDSMIRAKLFFSPTDEKEEYILLLTMHHIASDAWSMSLLAKELTHLYKAYHQGITPSLSVLPIQYIDFSIWQKEYFKGAIYEQQLTYWKKQLADLAPLDLPTDYPRPKVQAFQGSATELSINADLTTALKQLSAQHGTTLYMTLLAAFLVLLHRYSGQNDIAVGSPIANRHHKEVEDLIGFFINTLVIRLDLEALSIPSASLTFSQLLEQVKIISKEAYEHQDMPFEVLVKELQPERSINKNPFFQISFTLQNVPEEKLQLADLQVAPIGLADQYTRLDQEWTLFETDNLLQLKVIYSTTLYNESTIQRMLLQYQTLLQSIVEQPSQYIGKLEILPYQEKQLLLNDFNDTKKDLPSDKTIIDLFEEQVEKTPNNIAVVFEETKLTYRQLNEKANQVGHYLRTTYDIQSDDIIALQLERSEWMIIAILGVLKAGAAYLPIAPDAPTARTAFMLRDAKAKVLLTDETTHSTAATQKDILAIEVVKEIKSRKRSNPQLATRNPNNLAYVIYTSGSTGQPKGVMIEHVGPVNMALSQINEFAISENDTILQFANYTFDAVVWEIFMTLLAGAKLIMAKKNIVTSPNNFLDLLVKHQVSIVTLPPVFLANFNSPIFDGLRVLITAGEKPNIQDVITHSQNLRYFNAFGPTEYSVCISTFEVPRNWQEAFIPIGQPIQNTEVFILDNKEQLLPIGIAGELGVSGIGLARGYLNKPELTAEKFIPHPFKQGERLYKTGDLARWLPDGNIEFLGRIDNQLKIRGYRIEAGEVEQALLAHPAIKAVVVIGSEVADTKELVAYLVPTTIRKNQEAVENSEQAMPDIATLRSFLAESLPDYMIPTYLVMLDSLPLTSSGKINHKALPSPHPDSLASGIAYEGPRNPIEQTLVDLWEEILGRQAISIHDNFFAIGGHSLRAIRLVALIQQQLAVKIKLTQIFTQPTIAALAEHIAQVRINTLLKKIAKSNKNKEQKIEESW